MHLVPSIEEFRAWILQTARHSCHVEYYLKELGIDDEDPERPHDIVGDGNKFEAGVIEGFSMQYRERTQEHFERVVQPSLTRHRCQYHHRMWNHKNDAASALALKLGAVDALCSLLEPRDYQGGSHDWPQIEAIIAGNPEHKRPWLTEVLGELRLIVRPPLHLIVSLDELPNVGVSAHVHDVVRQRVSEARTLVLERYGIVV